MLKYTVIASALLLSLSVNSLAQIYKTVDDEGNVSFGDQPQKSSEQLDLPKPNTAQAIEVLPKSTITTAADTTQGAFNYKSLKITSPADDTGIPHGTGDLSVSISNSPALRKEDKIRLLLDGKAHSDGSSSSFQLNDIDRGSHTLQALIIGDSGKVLKKSSTITVHIMRTSVVKPGR